MDSSSFVLDVTNASTFGTGIVKLMVFASATDSVVEIIKINLAKCITGISKVSESQLVIFPSPFESSFSVKINTSIKPKFLEVYNVIGTVVYKQELNGDGIADMATITPGNLPKGLYFVSISDADRKVLTTKRIQKD
jgi:hypothetical protein